MMLISQAASAVFHYCLCSTADGPHTVFSIYAGFKSGSFIEIELHIHEDPGIKKSSNEYSTQFVCRVLPPDTGEYS